MASECTKSALHEKQQVRNCFLDCFLDCLLDSFLDCF